MFFSSTLLAIALATPHTAAGNGYESVLLIVGSNDILFRTNDPNARGVDVAVESDAGREALVLGESDA